MMKRNKKGFTLIEMLVVIAIIAVLVAIVIPTVSSSTDKAGAAANAANLRAIVAEATTKLLASDASDSGNVQLTFTYGVVTGIKISENAPKSAKVGNCAKGQDVILTWDADNGFRAYYGDYSLNSFLAVADGSKASSELATDKPASGEGVVSSKAPSTDD